MRLHNGDSLRLLQVLPFVFLHPERGLLYNRNYLGLYIFVHFRRKQSHNHQILRYLITQSKKKKKYKKFIFF